MNFLILLGSLMIFCVVGQSNLVKPLVEGFFAARKQFPYQAHLILDFGGSTSDCGGVLISERWVLTAAHCLVDPNVERVIVQLGYTDLNDSANGAQFLVEKSSIFLHDYLGKEIDIALLRLPDNVPINDFIQPAILPSISEPSPSYEGQLAVATGWANGVEGDNRNVLRYTRVQIISDAECKTKSGRFQYRANLVCVSPYMNSNCFGDFGGALVVHDGPSNHLIGIGTALFDQCAEGLPGGFTRITLFLDWIQRTTAGVDT